MWSWMHTSGGVSPSHRPLKAKLCFLAKDIGRKAGRGSKGWFPLELHGCQNNPLGINELKAKLESSSFRKSNLSSGRWWSGWRSCKQLHGGLQATGLEGYGLLWPLFLALFFIGVSNHIRVFKWHIKEYRDWSLASIEICWAAFTPIRGEFRPLAHPML